MNGAKDIKNKTKIFDYVFIGTGIIAILEALHKSNQNSSVLMIDEGKKIGGAWASLNLFGFQNVENAVHYILPDETAFRILKENLGLNLNISEKKYRVFNLPFGLCAKIPFDNKLGKIISSILKKNYSKVKSLLLSESKSPSYYLNGGASDITSKLQILLKKSKVKILFKTKITNVEIQSKNALVKIITSKNKIYAKKIVITHGTKLPMMIINKKRVFREKKQLYRPSIHLLFDDKEPSQTHEAIFENDNLIKYAHDISRYAKSINPSLAPPKNKKIIVCALSHTIRLFESLPSQIESRLKKIGLLGSFARLNTFFWQDIFLPELDNSDLLFLKSKSCNKVEILQTENLSKALKLYSSRWFSN